MAEGTECTAWMQDTARSTVDRAHWLEFVETRTVRMRDKLVERYLGLARAVAGRIFQRRGDDTVPFADYLQYARVGLVEAIDSFDPHRAVPFEAFSSFRIRGAILNGLTGESEIAAQRAFHARRLRATLDSPGKIVVELTSRYMELDESETIDESIGSNPFAVTELSQLQRAVRSMLVDLPERERDLIRRHYEEHVEFQQIAAEWGVTKGRVSQLHSQALSRLRLKLLPAPFEP